MPIAPIMIYGDDVSHVVTEEGIAYLYKAEGQEERRRALAAVAGVSPVGLKAIAAETAALRKKGVVAYPEDLGVHRLEAKRRYSRRGACRIWSPGPVALQPAGAFSELVMSSIVRPVLRLTERSAAVRWRALPDRR